MSPIIAAIDRRRKELRMSQSELARRANTTQSHISDILNERIGASLRVTEKLCAALDLRLVVVDPEGNPATAMHPATVAVASNQRRLAKVMQEMTEIVAAMAGTLEKEEVA